jgi:hypothetical protein
MVCLRDETKRIRGWQQEWKSVTVVKLLHNKEMNRRPLHSGVNTRGDGWRAYEAVHPINQETRILGADAAAAKVRVPVANVWRAWREEIRPAKKAFSHSSLLSTAMRQNSSCDARDAK